MRLHINIDHVATLRNARGTPYPDPIQAAQICLESGADGITAHLREDRRHIKDGDMAALRELLVKRLLNMEMAATDEMVEIALGIKPDVVTLVPERREERTTEGGLDVAAGGEALAKKVARLTDAGIKVSMFIAADPKQIDVSKAIGATQIELHTGDYAHAFADISSDDDLVRSELVRLAAGSAYAARAGLEVAAGHGLTQDNVGPLLEIPQIEELNIGHAVIADAIFMGLAGAVKAMRARVDEGRVKRTEPS
jgi:pyridoxine 5-phosphate synthase